MEKENKLYYKIEGKGRNYGSESLECSCPSAASPGSTLIPNLTCIHSANT